MLRLKKNKTPDVEVSTTAIEPAPVVTTPPMPTATDEFAPVVTDVDAPAKKPLPKAAIIGGALGSLALLGAAAYFLTRPPAEPDTPSMPVRTASMPGGNGVGMGAPGGNGASVTTANSVSVTTPGTMPMTGANGVTMPGSAKGNAVTTTTSVTSRPAVPGTGVPGMPMGAGASSTNTNAEGADAAAPPMPVVAAAAMPPHAGPPPTLAPPTMNRRPMMTPLTPAIAAQLKALWLEGAAAKHRGNYDAAREAWNKGLQLRPGHPGFAEAIRKLPARR